MSREEEIVEAIKEHVNALKYKLERQDAIDKLATFDMTIDRLIKTKAALRLTDVFRSSRFEMAARDLHQKWMTAVQRELKDRWDEVKHQFLTKDQLNQLDRAQKSWNKKNGIIDPSATTKKAPPVRTENPYQRVYQRYNAALEPLDMRGPSTSASPPQPSPYGAASSAVDPDTNFVAYNYSTVAIRRPRGRPRTNFSVKGEGRKRGRPPTRRH